MSKKILWVLIICLTASLSLVSCQRAASQSPVATSTATHAVALATQPANGVGSVQIIATQSAMAQTVQPGSTTPNGSAAISTSTPFGTPAAPITVVPPIGGASTPIIISTPIPGTTQIFIVPTATPGRPATYTVMQGDFPYCIARRFNVNQQELLSLNGITTGQGLQPGKVLNIPQTGNPFVGVRALHTHPSTFTVTTVDETIYGVACYFGDVDPTQIIAANGLASPYTLHINQVLNIP